MAFGFLKKGKPEKLNAQLELATSCWDSGKKEEAVQEMAKALKMNPNSHVAWFGLGRYCDSIASSTSDQEMKAKAVNCLLEAVRLKPDFAEAYYLLGNVVWDKDFRESVKFFRAAVQYDSRYEKDLESAVRLVTECTIKLVNLPLFYLQSLREQPESSILDCEFYFQEEPVGSGVVYSCTRSSKSQWAEVWLFSSTDPDLLGEEPVANVTISSVGDVGISAGTPANYRLLVEKFQANDWL